MHTAGRLLAFRDDAGVTFSFAICPRCADRLDRLPVKTHTDVAEARLYIAVEAAHLRGEF